MTHEEKKDDAKVTTPAPTPSAPPAPKPAEKKVEAPIHTPGGHGEPGHVHTDDEVAPVEVFGGSVVKKNKDGAWVLSDNVKPGEKLADEENK